MKKDGHTHTQYCLHGSGEETERFVIKAIEEGFDIYTFTEHLPVPATFHKESVYSQELMRNKLCMIPDQFDVDKYIREMYELKKKYKDRIQLLVGFEIDYLPDHLDWTRSLIKEYGKYIEEAIISVHVIKGVGGYRWVAYDKDDFTEGLINYYGSLETVQAVYLRHIKEAVLTDFGLKAPTRVGHMTYCNKFQNFINKQNYISEEMERIVDDLLETIKEKNYGIDVNVSGLSYKHYKDFYPSKWIIKRCLSKGISMTYGSDSHSVDNVGRFYTEYQQFIGN